MNKDLVPTAIIGENIAIRFNDKDIATITSTNKKFSLASVEKAREIENLKERISDLEFKIETTHPNLKPKLEDTIRNLRGELLKLKNEPIRVVSDFSKVEYYKNFKRGATTLNNVVVGRFKFITMTGNEVSTKEIGEKGVYILGIYLFGEKPGWAELFSENYGCILPSEEVGVEARETMIIKEKVAYLKIDNANQGNFNCRIAFHDNDIEIQTYPPKSEEALKSVSEKIAKIMAGQKVKLPFEPSNTIVKGNNALAYLTQDIGEIKRIISITPSFIPT